MDRIVCKQLIRVIEMKNQGIGLLMQGYNIENELPISFLVISEKREKLLLLLHEGPKTLQEIKDSLAVTSAGIIPEIRKMEDKMLVNQKNREYDLTEIGEIVAESMFRFEGTLRVIRMNLKFWDEHNISAIPNEFRQRIHELGNYQIVKSTPNDIFRPQKEYMKNLLNARRLKAVSPVLHPDYPEYVINLADKGVPVSIIVTRDLLNVIKEKFGKELRRGLAHENTNILVCDDPVDLSFSVTDFFLSMRLFLKDNNYDFFQNILSFEKSAVRWGEDLFNHYEKISRRVRLEDI